MSASEKDAQAIVSKAVTHFECDAPPALSRYLSEVLQWNDVLNLVSRKDPIAACARLLFESIELGQVLDIGRARLVADVGSGAGFPGMVWALMHPDLHMTLIERREKRALFLERTSRALGAGNVRVLATDIRDVPREIIADRFDLISTMAVGDPSVLAADIEPLLLEGGRFASTVPRDFIAAPRLATGLQLERRVDGKFGCYIIYRNGV
jgi:16S rRNA (guanine(527)-N(7))-methyltransferase RsmG